ncbi:MAG: FGGY-family carbohydrate kinase [Hyphomicrobiales bacterium]
MTLLLGIDSGLTITKAVLFNAENGEPVAVARKKVAQLHPQDHHVERDLETLWATCVEVIQQVITKSGIDPSQIAAVSQTAHGDGLYLLDKNQNPLGNGSLSLDSRAHDIVAQWRSDGTAKNSLAFCGQEPGVSSPAAILAWIKQHEPERYANIGSVFSCKDYIRFCLTNAIGTDRTEASTAFTDVQTQDYSPRATDIFGLDGIFDCLAPILNPTDVAGVVTQQAADQTGLKAGTPVAVGLHDVCASALGINAHKLNTLSIIAGTYSINQVVSAKPITSPHWFCRSAVEDSLWNNMSISPASSGTYDWYVTALLEGADGDHAKRAKEAESILLDGTNSVFFHPFLYGSPYAQDASGSLVGLRGWHGQEHITAAVLEGIVFNHCVHIERLSEAFDFEKVCLTGGISRNPAVAQYVADAINQEIDVADVEEAACWGVALCAGVAVGCFENMAEAAAKITPKTTIYRPDENRSAKARNRFESYKSQIVHLKNIWSELDRLEKGRES